MNEYQTFLDYFAKTTNKTEKQKLNYNKALVPKVKPNEKAKVVGLDEFLKIVDEIIEQKYYGNRLLKEEINKFILNYIQFAKSDFSVMFTSMISYIITYLELFRASYLNNDDKADKDMEKLLNEISVGAFIRLTEAGEDNNECAIGLNIRCELGVYDGGKEYLLAYKDDDKIVFKKDYEAIEKFIKAHYCKRLW